MLRRARRGLVIFRALAALSVATGVAMLCMPQRLSLPRVAAAAGVAVVSALASLPLASLQRQLTYTGYSHADR